MTWQARLRRWATPVVWVAAGLTTMVCLLLLLGTVRDDLAIASHPVRAPADVVSVSGTRTVVRFAGPDGAVHIPSQGVLYPQGLREGNTVWVEYDRADTDLVKVAGRGFTLALLPLGIIVLITWVVAGPALWWLHLRRRTDAGI